jgi:serine/threonine-protein kinase
MGRADSPDVIGSVIGSYRVDRVIGEGGMGRVYAAQHQLLGRWVAIKVLSPALVHRADMVERFFQEARTTSTIAAPGIVDIFDFGYTDEGSAFIVMELLDGESLEARLARCGRMAPIAALWLAHEIAISLAAAHARGIIHRDLKPANIFLVRDRTVGERVKILDFGIAKLLHVDRVKTLNGAFLGTPQYMSPEQCHGAQTLDHRADIYSLGCVLFQLLVGRPPFDGEGMGTIIAAHLMEAPPVPSTLVSGLTPAIDALLLRCLAKDPGDRYQSMAAVAAELARHIPISAAPDALTQLIQLPVTPTRAKTTTFGSSAGEVLPPTVAAREQPRRGRRFAIGAAFAIAAAFAGVLMIANTTVLSGGDPDAAFATVPVEPPPAAIVDAMVDTPAPVIEPTIEPDLKPARPAKKKPIKKKRKRGPRPEVPSCDGGELQDPRCV